MVFSRLTLGTPCSINVRSERNRVRMSEWTVNEKTSGVFESQVGKGQESSPFYVHEGLKTARFWLSEQIMWQTHVHGGAQQSEHSEDWLAQVNVAYLVHRHVVCLQKQSFKSQKTGSASGSVLSGYVVLGKSPDLAKPLSQ